MSGDRIRLALPKGSLQKDTAGFLAGAGIVPEGYVDGRDYRPKLDIPWIEVKVLRPQEIPLYVSQGYYDVGITGIDWVLESRTGDEVEVLLDCNYGRVDIVTAVPDTWDQVNSFEELVSLPGEVRISTEYLNLTQDMVLRTTGVEPTILTPWYVVRRHRYSNVVLILSFGATEGKPPEDAEAVVDNTATGSTLRANGLKIICNVLTGSTARLVANRGSLHDPAKGHLLEQLAAMLEDAAGLPPGEAPGRLGSHVH
jgi:ATP phosphoribosyltransferase